MKILKRVVDVICFGAELAPPVGLVLIGVALMIGGPHAWFY